MVNFSIVKNSIVNFSVVELIPLRSTLTGTLCSTLTGNIYKTIRQKDPKTLRLEVLNF